MKWNNKFIRFAFVSGQQIHKTHFLISIRRGRFDSQFGRGSAVKRARESDNTTAEECLPSEVNHSPAMCSRVRFDEPSSHFTVSKWEKQRYFASSTVDRISLLFPHFISLILWHLTCKKTKSTAKRERVHFVKRVIEWRWWRRGVAIVREWILLSWHASGMSKCRMRNWMIWDGLDRLLCEPHMCCVCTAPRKIIQEWEISTFFCCALSFDEFMQKREKHARTSLDRPQIKKKLITIFYVLFIFHSSPLTGYQQRKFTWCRQIEILPSRKKYPKSLLNLLPTVVEAAGVSTSLCWVFVCDVVGCCADSVKLSACLAQKKSRIYRSKPAKKIRI